MTMGHCILLDKDDANLYKSAQYVITCDLRMNSSFIFAHV